MASLCSDLTLRQYAGIGKIACEWSHVEQTLQELLWVVADVPPDKGLKISTELGAVTLLNMLLALARDGHFDEDRQPPIYHAILGVSERINILRGKRNHYVHRDWMRQGRGPVIEALHFKADGKLVGRHVKTTVAEMDAVALEMWGLNQKLIQIKQDFRFGRLVALPHKSRRQLRRDRHNARTSSGKTPSSPQ